MAARLDGLDTLRMSALTQRREIEQRLRSSRNAASMRRSRLSASQLTSATPDVASSGSHNPPQGGPLASATAGDPRVVAELVANADANRRKAEALAARNAELEEVVTRQRQELVEARHLADFRAEQLRRSLDLISDYAAALEEWQRAGASGELDIPGLDAGSPSGRDDGLVDRLYDAPDPDGYYAAWLTRSLASDRVPANLPARLSGYAQANNGGLDDESTWVRDSIAPGSAAAAGSCRGARRSLSMPLSQHQLDTVSMFDEPGPKPSPAVRPSTFSASLHRTPPRTSPATLSPAPLTSPGEVDDIVHQRPPHRRRDPIPAATGAVSHVLPSLSTASLSVSPGAIDHLTRSARLRAALTSSPPARPRLTRIQRERMRRESAGVVGQSPGGGGGKGKGAAVVGSDLDISTDSEC